MDRDVIVIYYETSKHSEWKWHYELRETIKDWIYDYYVNESLTLFGSS
jgi:hypothetical protein